MYFLSHLNVLKLNFLKCAFFFFFKFVYQFVILNPIFNVDTTYKSFNDFLIKQWNLELTKMDCTMNISSYLL